LEIDVAKVSGGKNKTKKATGIKNKIQSFYKKLTPLFLRLQQIIQVKEMYQTVVVPQRST